MFTEEGGKRVAEDDIQNQRKKKVLFITKERFPYIKTSSPVIDTKDIILTPIESSLELIVRQTNMLRKELELLNNQLDKDIQSSEDSSTTESASVPQINRLQQVIQGSIMPSMKIYKTNHSGEYRTVEDMHDLFKRRKYRRKVI